MIVNKVTVNKKELWELIQNQAGQKNWVAELTENDPKDKFKRKFLNIQTIGGKNYVDLQEGKFYEFCHGDYIRGIYQLREDQLYELTSDEAVRRLSAAGQNLYGFTEKELVTELKSRGLAVKTAKVYSLRDELRSLTVWNFVFFPFFIVGFLNRRLAQVVSVIFKGKFGVFVHFVVTSILFSRLVYAADWYVEQLGKLPFFKVDAAEISTWTEKLYAQPVAFWFLHPQAGLFLLCMIAFLLFMWCGPFVCTFKARGYYRKNV